ncbi:hypothetical protein QTP88_020162 [Uroleucon formosanum]
MNAAADMEKYDRFIMSMAVYSCVCFTYIIMVYVGRDVARITAIARLIIILYYTPGGGVDCRRHCRLRLVAIVKEIEKQCSMENGRPTSANKYTRFRLVVFKGRGIVLCVIHRTVISSGRSIRL